MNYEIKFKPKTLKKFKKLDKTIKSQFLDKLEEIVQDVDNFPHKRLCLLHHDFCKIRIDGFRLLYQIIDDQLVIEVSDVGRRDEIYDRLRGLI